MAYDTGLQDMVLVDQLPSDTWAQGICVRPAGDIITTHLNGPELFNLTSARSPASQAPPRIIYSFPDATGTFNICPLVNASCEEYAVVTAQSDLANGEFADWNIWRVVMPPEGDTATAPRVTKLAQLPDAGFLMGMVAISEHTLTVADSFRGCIWRIDIPTGRPSILIDHPSLGPPSATCGAGIFGINRMVFTDRHCWAINTGGSGSLYRFPITRTSHGQDIRPTGPVELVTSGLENAEGLVITRDGRSVYICSWVSGYLWRVDVDTFTHSVIRDDLVSPTAMDLVYDDDDNDPDSMPTLYILCCGEISKESVEEGDQKHWLGMAQVEPSKLQITVTVTTEVTYEYV